MPKWTRGPYGKASDRRKHEAVVYNIMHAEKCVAQVSTAGECKIDLEVFMLYDAVQPCFQDMSSV